MGGLNQAGWLPEDRATYISLLAGLTTRLPFRVTPEPGREPPFRPSAGPAPPACHLLI